jgi:hypothetical protein
VSSSEAEATRVVAASERRGDSVDGMKLLSMAV